MSACLFTARHKPLHTRKGERQHYLPKNINRVLDNNVEQMPKPRYNVQGGYRPQRHGERFDAYNKQSNLAYAGTIALQTFMANDRFVVIEL